MRVIFFERNKEAGFSIHKVMAPIMTGVENATIIEMKHLGANPVSILLNMLQAWLNRKADCIYHITGDVHYLSFVLPKKRTITTVHDLVSMKYNEYSWIKKRMLSFLYVESLKRNKLVVCISEKTKNEVLSLINLSENNICVIPNSISDDFHYEKRDFNSLCPVVLHIGTKSNKNLHRTIEALNGMKVKLRIIGKLDSDTKELLLQNNISYTVAYNIDDEEIREEYNKCDIVNFPSLYEGFGMPIIEAQATGRICLTSDMEPMRSVSGGYAIFVNPYSVGSIREGYITIIKDVEKRESLIKGGLDNVKSYRQSKVVKNYTDIYNQIDRDYHKQSI